MIDFSSEPPITLKRAGRVPELCRDGRPASYWTLWRWGRVGSIGTDGVRVKLEIARVGGTWCTSLASIRRYLERLNGATTSARTSGQKERSLTEAEAELDACGIS